MVPENQTSGCFPPTPPDPTVVIHDGPIGHNYRSMQMEIFKNIWLKSKLLPICELIHPNAKAPSRNPDDPQAAGYDLFTPEEVVLRPGTLTIIPLGIKTEFPDGRVGLIFDRSGLGVRGVSRHCGVIDSSYRGEWRVALYNHSVEPIIFRAGDRVAQVVFVDHYSEPFQVGVVNNSDRGEKGFGSSGA